VPTATYLQGAHGVVKAWMNGSAFYYYQDSLGSTTHIADADGNLLESYRYDLYGKPSYYDASQPPQPLNSSTYNIVDLYAGERWIGELGVYDLRNRFMSPELGRFLQTDPIGFKGDASNLYRYCHNDPEDFSDPMGLVPSITEDRMWKTACFFDGGNSFQGSWQEFNNRNQPAGTAQSSTPGGNYKDTNIQNHIKKGQENPGGTKYTNSNEGGVVKPTIDWWVKPGYENTKVVLGELEHVSRLLWSSEKGDLAAAVRKFNANPNTIDAKLKLENARLVEMKWHDLNLHNRNVHGNLRHDVSANPELRKTMTSKEVERAIQNVSPHEDPRPYYLGY
jgi:RHS repeat-associated protein